MVYRGLHVHSHMGLRMARREEVEHMGHRIVEVDHNHHDEVGHEMEDGP